MLLDELIHLLAVPPLPEGEPRLAASCDEHRTAVPAVPVPCHTVAADQNPPYDAQHRASDHEPQRRDEQPVVAHPEDEPRVAAVPRVALVFLEEGPRVLAVLVRHEDADAAGPVGAFIGVVGHPVLPEHGEEERAGRGHNGDVGQDPAVVVALELGDDVEEEGVLGHGAHGIVGDAGGDGAAQPCFVGEERVEAALAAVVEVDVHAAVGREDEVADRVGALDGVGVVFKGLEEPGVFFRDEGLGGGVAPEDVLVVWV